MQAQAQAFPTAAGSGGEPAQSACEAWPAARFLGRRGAVGSGFKGKKGGGPRSKGRTGEGKRLAGVLK
nr:unnamed protein product [Digitaria exilis]